MIRERPTEPALIAESPRGWVEKTDVAAYARRQAQSCQYLEALFAVLEAVARPIIPRISDLLACLLRVHRRQYEDLAAVLSIPDADGRRSFYFEALYARFGLSSAAMSAGLSEDALLTVLSIQAVSYLRGHDRYRLLKDYDAPENTALRPVWAKFFADARKNADVVLESLRTHFGERAHERVRAALAVEDEVIRGIWRRNGVA